MKWTSLLILGIALGGRIAAAQQPAGPTSPILGQVRAACLADVQKLCPNVQPGGGRIIDCLAQRKDDVSAPCKQAIIQARQAQGPVQGQAQRPAPTPGPTPGQGQGQSQNQNLPPTAGFSP